MMVFPCGLTLHRNFIYLSMGRVEKIERTTSEFITEVSARYPSGLSAYRMEVHHDSAVTLWNRTDY